MPSPDLTSLNVYAVKNAFNDQWHEWLCQHNLIYSRLCLLLPVERSFKWCWSSDVNIRGRAHRICIMDFSTAGALCKCKCFVVQLCKFWHCTKPLRCAAHWKVLVIRCQYPREGSSHLHNELSSTAIPGLPILCSTVSATTLYCTKWTFWHCTKAFVMWHEVSFSSPAHLYNQLLLWGRAVHSRYLP